MAGETEVAGVVMWMRDESLKLGKSSAFVKRDLRVLSLTEAEFEADFFLDRKFSTKDQRRTEKPVPDEEKNCG